MEISKTYEPQQIEKKWYEFWERNDYFKPAGDPSKPPFTVLIPPPNVTGILHMGHVLNNTLQDIVVFPSHDMMFLKVLVSIIM